jgi:hypothetical protein
MNPINAFVRSGLKLEDISTSNLESVKQRRVIIYTKQPPFFGLGPWLSWYILHRVLLKDW